MTDDIEIPEDTRRSRLTPPASFADPDDIATLDERITAFWEAYPDGAIDASEVEQTGETSWMVTAYVWKNGDSEGRADSTGSATRTVDLDGHVSAQFALETAQSIAISRALRFLGFRS
ncbi:hypothetical protein [Microbacterium plantarum]|uniref:hypothetical protein n=1 Tax=Microbacterium plantarum TaxID=1816425 RepID=UPI002B48722E|nr:hypothetical protein [Microbacterium plantarum]WRK16531.1 hypothetical protein VC184_11495 [Microbacterium plantarum]